MRVRQLLALWALAWGLVACGGGEVSTQLDRQAATFRDAVRAAAPAGSRTMRPLAASSSVVDPADAAEQLLDFAEAVYPEYFPGHPVSGLWEGYRYRFHAATGIYLGVRDAQVYVLGGVFGQEVLHVGALEQFITPVVRPLAALDPCTSGGADWALASTPTPTRGRNVAAMVAGCTGAIGQPRWRQTAGASVALPGETTQVISFDAPEPGVYTFEVSFVDPAGRVQQRSLSLQVGEAAPAPTRLTLRASLAVRMGGKVSVRAWPTLPDGDEVESIQWSQPEGPTVELDTRDDHAALFVAPDVQRDTLIRLRAALRTKAGRTASDEVLVLVEHHVQAAAEDVNASWAGEHVSRVHAYRADGPYASLLVRCVYDTNQRWDGTGLSPCTLAELPLLAQDTSSGQPTVEQVMNRVVVSHDWLGRNFETFLRTQDPQGDLRRMLSSVTAIVISTGIRPSFYWAGTGAIYLDGDNFWLTPEERDTVNEAPDYRSDFDNGLAYSDVWRYVEGNQSIFAHFDARKRVTRSGTDLRNEATWLMFHELGHALDFIPPGLYKNLDRRSGVWANISQRYSTRQLTSDTVPARYPLTASALIGLAQVKYQGVEATPEQRMFRPDEIGVMFAADLATDDYSYSTSREDVAMTLEEVLMSNRLGIRRDTAFTDRIDKSSTASPIVRWGQRGRVGEPAIRPRAKDIVRQLVPWLDAAVVDSLPPPLAMRIGETWKDNLVQPGPSRMARALSARPAWLDDAQWQRDLRHIRRQHREKRLPPLPGGGAVNGEAASR